jgi:hypothetical protein
MTGLAGEVEKIMTVFDQGRHRGRIAYVSKIDRHPVADVIYIKKVAAIFRDQAVNERDLRLKVDKAPRQGRADEAQPARDENVRPDKNVVVPRHRRILGRGQKDFL